MTGMLCMSRMTKITRMTGRTMMTGMTIRDDWTWMTVRMTVRNDLKNKDLGFNRNNRDDLDAWDQ